MKLALFFDWLFFRAEETSIMNIEPGLLILINSVHKYANITSTLLEFLWFISFEYYPEKADNIKHCIDQSVLVCIKKGVVPSLDPLLKSANLSSDLKTYLKILFPSAFDSAVKSVPKRTTSPIESPPPKRPLLEMDFVSASKLIEITPAEIASFSDLLSFMRNLNENEMRDQLVQKREKIIKFILFACENERHFVLDRIAPHGDLILSLIMDCYKNENLYEYLVPLLHECSSFIVFDVEFVQNFFEEMNPKLVRISNNSRFFPTRLLLLFSISVYLIIILCLRFLVRH